MRRPRWGFVTSTLEAQEAAIREECLSRGWRLAYVVRDEGQTGATLERPELRALESIAEGVGDVLMVSRLDRATRSVGDLVALLAWFEQIDGGAFVTLAAMVDTTTITGRLIAHMLAALGEWERSVIADRTRQALMAARAQGRPISRPAVSDDLDLASFIGDLRREGLTYREIAARLNQAGVPTPRGGSEWRPSSLQRTLAGPRRAKRHSTVALPDPSAGRPRRRARVPRTSADIAGLVA
jgi:DNA invertase Pin-like site-specific DNA recombinase